MRARAGFVRSILAALVLVAASAAVARAQAPPPAYKPGEVLVKFRSTTSAVRVHSLSQAIDGDIVRTFPKLGIEVMQIGTGSVEDAVALLRNDPDVVFAEPNYLLYASLTPDDPMYPQLWGLSNTGQTGGTPGADIHAPQAWTTFTGSGSVLVGVIDTGADYNHPDLALNMFVNAGEIPGNGIDDDNNLFIDDVHGWDFANNDNDPIDDHYHGTHVSGTIGAVGNNGIGVVGVNWNVRILPIKFLDAGGSGSTEGAIASIDYAVKMGVRVINASWGGGGFSEALRLSIAAAGDAGVLFVAAAGNNGGNNDLFPHYPSTYDLDNIVSVAATDRNDQLAGFSNYGVQTVDLGAPGVDVLSTMPGVNYGTLSGTSMAAPHVAGVAALVLGRFPAATSTMVKALLLQRAQAIPALAGRVLTGARLDALGAISDPDSLAPSAVSDLATIDPNGSRVTLQWTAPGDDGATGTAFAYDVRYSTSPITALNFDAATPATGEPGPSPAGSSEQMTVHGLAFSTGYHFALRALDEFGNASPVSNDASATTLGPPDIAVAPDSLSASLLTGETTSRTLTVSNSGVSDLVFTIRRVVQDSALAIDVLTAKDGVPERVLASGRSVPLARLAGIFPAVRKVGAGDFGTPDRQGVMRPQGGGSGLRVNARNEEVFGNTDNSFFAGPRTRGNIFQCTTSRQLREHRFYLQLGVPTELWFLVYEGAAAVGNYTLVSASSMNAPAGAPGWYSSGNLDVPLVEGRYYLIVASFNQVSGYYNQVGINPYPVPASFGTLIAGAGWLWAPTSDFPPALNQQVPPEAFGDPVAYYQTIVTDDQVTWISAYPETASVSAGSQLELAVTFDAAGLNDGDYDAQLLFESNDPDEPVFPVGAHLHVTGAPDIAASPESMEFGLTFLHIPKSDSLEVRNVGTRTLNVSGVSAAPSVFSVDPGGFTLAPGDARVLLVSFTPVAPGQELGAVTFLSDDPDEATFLVPLHGTGIIAPIASVTPGSIDADLFTGESTTRTVTISNPGGSDLVFNVSIDAHPEASVRIVRSLPEEPAGVGAPPSRPAPAGYQPKAPLHVATPGADVLLIQDALPWGSPANQQILAANGIAYDLIGSAQLASTNLDDYEVVIVASDQPHPTYLTLIARAAQINTFVQHGGRLEFHAAGWGWNGGDPSGITLPGGMGITPYFPGLNYVLLPDHPIVAGVPNPFTGNSASHAFFTNIPAGAELIISDDLGRPDLVSYRYGAGRVIASAQTLEYGVMSGQPAGIVLQNLIPYVASGGIGWLSAEPVDGIVPAGGSLNLTFTFDADGLNDGDYLADVHVESNDPVSPDVLVAAHLHVTGAPDVAVDPDSLDFGTPFIGVQRTDTLDVRNEGTANLNVSSVVATPGVFSADPGGFTLAPGARRTLIVGFTPVAAGEVLGSLTLNSDDPDQPALVVPLHGTGLIAPIAQVTPDSMGADLFTGQTATRTLTISNSGGSDLVFDILIGDVEASAVRIAVLPPDGPGREGGAPANATPAGYSSQASPKVTTPGANVLLIQDYLPWGSTADQQVLNANAIAFDGIGSAQIAGTDLEAYQVVIVAGDQPGFAYANIASRAAQIDAFVQHGGRLEFHAAGWGWNGGDPSGITLPGGMHIEPYFAQYNNILMPDHPIVAGVPNPVTGFPSHANFTSIPAGADLIVGDDLNRPNLVSYRYGAGRVIAAGQNLEYGFQYGYPSGLILQNLIPYVVSGTSGWLTADPFDGVVPAGGSLEVTVTFDATGLFGGTYLADIAVRSNDPARPELNVAARLGVTGVPDVALQGSRHQVVSSATFTGFGSSTQHMLALPSQPGTDGVLHVGIEGDFNFTGETATVIVEGTTLGQLGERGFDCVPDSAQFELSNPQLVQFGADRVMAVTVQNSPTVEPYCFANRHTVRLEYRDPSDLLEFGIAFVGSCRSETLEVANVGTDSLRLEPPQPDHPWFTAGVTSLTLAPNAKALLVVTFCAAGTQSATGTLTLETNDPDEGQLVVALHGTGAVPPDIAVNPSSFDVDVEAGTIATRPLRISNTGGPLLWNAGSGPPQAAIVVETSPTFEGGPALPKDAAAAPGGSHFYTSSRTPAVTLAATPGPVSTPPGAALEDVLADLDAHYAEVTAAIPNPYPFQEGVVGFNIGDGGNDMYDGGNMLRTNFGGFFMYSDGVIQSSPYLGPNGRYFTRKYPGLFVFVADFDSVSGFSIEGNLGADGSGLLDGAVFDVAHNGDHRAFVKRVFSAGDPSVNHLVIVTGNEGTHSFPTDTNDDFHAVSGINSTRIYYLLYAGTNGGYIDNASTLGIMHAFLDALPALGSVAVAPSSGGLPGGGSVDVEVSFDAQALLGGEYPGQIVLLSNDPDESPLVIPTLMRVRGVPDIVVVPDSLDLGSSFIGVTQSDSLEVRNVGTGPLTVSTVAASPGVFFVNSGGFTLAPGERHSILVGFTPAAEGLALGAVTFSSDDPDEPAFAVPLRGTGLVPPVIAVTPDSLSADLMSGGSTTRTLTIANTGGSALEFQISITSSSEAGARVDPVPSQVQKAAGLSERVPQGYESRTPAHVATLGAHTLLIQDLLPWNSEANQAVLDFNGIPYDLIGSAQLAGTNLGAYQVVIVPSDQPTSFYANLAARAAQIDAYVAAGGRLEFHAAGWGWNNGNAALVTLPGGMHIVQGVAYVNYVLLPGHPIMEGVPNPFTGTAASLARFTNIPVGASILATDDLDQPNLVRYGHGNGLVVATGQALEYGFSYGQDAGKILRNLIPFMTNGGISWLTVEPDDGIVPAGGSLEVTVTFDATDLDGGAYLAGILIGSNDPVRTAIHVPAHLNVLGASAVSVVEEPLRFGLAPVVPTPSRGAAHIAFTLTRPGQAKASIYDVAGRRVHTLLDGMQSAGRHALVWEGKDDRGARRSAGVYLLRLETEEGQRTERLVWIP